MKKMKLFLSIGILLFAAACSNGKDEPLQNKLIGTWIEKNPELYDGILDTIIFTEELSVKKHFYFDSWKYCVINDTISFQKGVLIRKFTYTLKGNSEIVINNFLDRVITSEVKDISFIKSK